MISCQREHYHRCGMPLLRSIIWSCRQRLLLAKIGSMESIVGLIIEVDVLPRLLYTAFLFHAVPVHLHYMPSIAFKPLTTNNISYSHG